MSWSPVAYVYGLQFDGGDIFYVGSTRNMTSRMKAHSSYKADAKYPYQRHILDGTAQGKNLEMIRLEVSNVNEVRTREAYWIWKLSGQVFNKTLPSWSALCSEDAAEIVQLEALISHSKERVAAILSRGRRRAREVHLGLATGGHIAAEQKAVGKAVGKTG